MLEFPYLEKSSNPPLLYFTDESHIRGSEFFGIGGLAVRPERASSIAKQLLDIRESNGIRDSSYEIKYKTAKRRRSDVYKAYIDYLAALIRDGQVHFHVRLKKAYGQRVSEETISKAHYSLMVHRAGRFYGRDCGIHFIPDNGNCTDYLPNLAMGINTDINRRYGGDVACALAIKPSCSKSETLLQLMDVTLGALTAARNGNHENGSTGSYKSEIIRYALNRLDCDIAVDTAITAKPFNIWNVG